MFFVFYPNMRIDKITLSQQTKKPVFGYEKRLVLTPQKKLLYRTTTCFFRDDLLWNNLMLFLQSKFRDVPKVQIINHACSDGEETYSLALKLSCYFKNEAQKFFPIVAKDLDKKNIETAKKGIYHIRDYEHRDIVENSDGRFNEFFELKNIEDFNYPNAKKTDKLLIVKDSLKEKINFQQANIVNDFSGKNEPIENTLLVCRNFWPYLKQEDGKNLLVALAKRIKCPSAIVFGRFDSDFELSNKLKKCGFTYSELPYVMQKFY